VRRESRQIPIRCLKGWAFPSGGRKNAGPVNKLLDLAQASNVTRRQGVAVICTRDPARLTQNAKRGGGPDRDRPGHKIRRAAGTCHMTRELNMCRFGW